jgi:hypothetical protein
VQIYLVANRDTEGFVVVMHGTVAARPVVSPESDCRAGFLRLFDA